MYNVRFFTSPYVIVIKMEELVSKVYAVYTQ